MPPKYKHKRLCAGCDQYKGFTRILNGYVCCSSDDCREKVIAKPAGTTTLSNQ